MGVGFKTFLTTAHGMSADRNLSWLTAAVIHVWMPPLVQGVFGRLEHVIGCFHVSGLKVRR